MSRGWVAIHSALVAPQFIVYEAPDYMCMASKGKETKWLGSLDVASSLLF
jgi:hypothetical protein